MAMRPPPRLSRAGLGSHRQTAHRMSVPCLCAPAAFGHHFFSQLQEEKQSLAGNCCQGLLRFLFHPLFLSLSPLK